MVRIPYIKIQSVRVRSIGPASNIGTGGATPAPPTPITYLTQWKIVGNSQVHTLPYPDGVVLPNGYKRCKYLELHGTEYINSGVLTKNDIGFRCQYSSINANESVFGAQSSSGDLFLFLLYTTNLVKTGYGGVSTTAAININPIDGNRHTLILDSEQCKIDNESVIVTRRTATLFYNVFIGTHNVANNADTRMFIGKIYELKIYDSSGNLFNGIPCLDDNNVPCLYDTVSGTSFYNDGTGTFGYEIEPQPTEIWSCGEYNATDGKYHILVKPEGGSIADIALDEPLRKVNDIADTIEFPSDTEGKALVTRNLKQINMSSLNWVTQKRNDDSYRYIAVTPDAYPYAATQIALTINTGGYNNTQGNSTYVFKTGRYIGMYSSIDNYPKFSIYDSNYNKEGDLSAFLTYLADKLIIYQLATPTTELVDAPQIEEADSYTMVISQGGKAVNWSSFDTDSE